MRSGLRHRVQWLKSGSEICLFKQRYAEVFRRRKTVRSNPNQTGQIGRGLLQSNSRFQACQAVGTEAAERRFGAINLPWHDNIHIGTIHEHELGRQNADNFVHRPI